MGGADCHSQCAHWLRNDTVNKGCSVRADVGSELSAAGGRSSEVSEWPRSKFPASAVRQRRNFGHRNRIIGPSDACKRCVGADRGVRPYGSVQGMRGGGGSAPPGGRGNRRSAAGGGCSEPVSRKCPDWRTRQWPGIGWHDGGQENPAPTERLQEVRGKNPPVTASPPQPPLGKGAEGTGVTDCHGRCAPSQ